MTSNVQPTNSRLPNNLFDTVVNRPLIVYAGLLAITTLWLALIFAAPWLLAQGQFIPAAIIYRGFSSMCHQISDRSFGFYGHQLGVCSRCTGIYAGFALGLIFYPVLRSLKETTFPARSFLVFAIIPMAIDFALGYLGLWANTFFSRTLTGLIFGSIVAFYILPGFVSAFSGSQSNNQTHKAVPN